jgi:hypothetical protein
MQIGERALRRREKKEAAPPLSRPVHAILAVIFNVLCFLRNFAVEEASSIVAGKARWSA